MTTGTARVTVPVLIDMKARGEAISVVTAYDASFARMFEEAGIDVLLVGDSLGMVIQGHETTLPVTLDEIIYHCRAVTRVTERAHIVGDMPFMSYHTSVEQAVHSAGRLVKEGGVHAVKLEGGRQYIDAVRAIIAAGIPVMGHVGLLPQYVHAMGGFRVQGKTVQAQEMILEEALLLAAAGAYAIVIEGVPPSVAATITNTVPVPTIGIGAGVECDGQVLVAYDLLGLTANLRPKFVKRYDEWYARGVDATRTYIREVRAKTFPGPEHTFAEAKALPPSKGKRAGTRAKPTTQPKRRTGYGPSDSK